MPSLRVVVMALLPLAVATSCLSTLGMPCVDNRDCGQGQACAESCRCVEGIAVNACQGAVATGGSTGTGGSTSTGGNTGTGGSVAVGGNTGTGGGTPTGGNTGTGGSVATGGSTGTGGGVATGGNTGTGGGAAPCLLSPPFSLQRSLPWPGNTGRAPSIALSRDGLAALGLPRDYLTGPGSVLTLDTNAGTIRLLSVSDGGLSSYGTSVAVPDLYVRVGIGVPYQGLTFAELLDPDGGLVDRPAGVFPGAYVAGDEVRLSGDGRTFAFSGRQSFITEQIVVRRPSGATTGASDALTSFADDFELDQTGQRLVTMACPTSPGACRVSVYGNVPNNIVYPRYDSDPLVFTLDDQAQVETSSDATWVAVSSPRVNAGKGRLEVLSSFGIGYQSSFALDGTQVQEGLGAALAMDATGELIAVTRKRTRTTSLYQRRSLTDGGLDYCEAQILPAYAAHGGQVSLTSDALRLAIVTEDGGVQIFGR